MLTLFCAPKAFIGHFAIIQRNAIRSWVRLRPACEIILLGNEKGIAELAGELGVRHIPEIPRNEFGTPLLDGMFETARSVATGDILGYVNSDIILMSDFIPAIDRIAACRKRFLMVGHRRDVVLEEELVFDTDWEQHLRSLVQQNLKFGDGMDFFVFPKDLWGGIPPFALGRFYWDDWFVYAARLRKAVVVDATPSVMAVHQYHDYSHLSGGKRSAAEGPESKRNYALLGNITNRFTKWEATHILTPSSMLVRCRSCYPVCVCKPDLI